MWSLFAYHEPSTSQLLILTSFLALLNLFGWGAQRLLSAGLLGQILIGIIFGTPIAQWLGNWEETLVAIGYVGLLLVVYEGGMQSSMTHLASVLPLSLGVALTGVLIPMALSFVLVPMGFSHLHAFAAGSSLVSTSLGTVLAILQPAALGFDLRQTRLGATLLSAAIIDDVVAFVLAKVLTDVGASGGEGGGAIGAGVGRTIGVTVGLGIVYGLVTRFVLRPLYIRFLKDRSSRILLCAHVPLFIGLIAAAGYAGTSPLYGVYVAGLSVAYLCVDDNKIAEDHPGELNRDKEAEAGSGAGADPAPSNSMAHSAGGECDAHERPTLISVFEETISSPLATLLLPVFFASIGFSTPFVALWRGAIIWRGIVYAVLMTLGKLACGGLALPIWGTGAWRGATLLGLAMVARGEIGLLIAQIARHTPTPLLDEDEFLVVIWAVMLCTIVGPIGVGVVTKRWGRRVLEGGLQ